MPTYGRFKDFTTFSTIITAMWTREIVVQSAVASLFNIQTSAKGAERTAGLSSLGLVPEYNGATEYDEFDPTNQKEFIHKEYVKGLKIPRTLIDDDAVGVIQAMIEGHAESFTRTVAYHMSSVFINAFSTTYTVYDGKALCATGRSGGKAVLTNKGTTALSHTALNDTRAAMRKFRDVKGNLIKNKPDTLVVGSSLEGLGHEIVVSEYRSDNANMADNPNKTLKLIVDDEIDDNSWFVVDSSRARKKLWWWWRVMPEFKIHPASDYDNEFRTRGYMRYSFGADDFSWIYGHEVT